MELNKLNDKMKIIISERQLSLLEGSNSPSQLEIGIKSESEHKDVYDLFQNYLKKNNLKMPISETNFYEMIAKKHLSEIPDYYTKLSKMEQDINESYEVDTIDPNEYSRKLIFEIKDMISAMINNLSELNEMGYDFSKEYKLTGKPIYGKIVLEIEGTIPKMLEDLNGYSKKLDVLSSNIKKIYV